MNIMFKINLIVLPLLVLGACANRPAPEVNEAQAGTQTEVSDGTQVASAKNKRVCKEVQPTGTRIAKKICKSQGAWDEIERTAKTRLDNMTKPQSNNPKGE